MTRWKLNDYEFLINPTTFNEDSKLVGDYPTSLNGTVYSLPTGYQTSYTLSSVMYQPRPKKISEFGIDGDFVQYSPQTDTFHVLNKTTKEIKTYARNFGRVITTSKFTGLPGTDVMGFDYAFGKYIILTKKDINNTWVCTAETNGTVTSTTTYEGVAHAVKMISSDRLWLVTGNSSIDVRSYPLLSSYSKVLELPTMSFITSGYQGICKYDDDFVVVFLNGIEECGVYHIEISTGHIVNYFVLPELEEYEDITYCKPENVYVFTSHIKKTVNYYKGNTVALDIYNLDSLIKGNQKITMVDDLGIPRNVNVTNYSFKRDPEHPYKYTVDLDITKIDRSV